MVSLRALLLSDGRPGHFKLAEGILAAIARRRPLEIARLDVRRRVLVPARSVSMLLGRGASSGLALRVAYGLAPSDIPECDLVVSAGGNTLGASVCAARLNGCPNIFYGSLRRFKRADFSLVLTSYAGQARASNQFMTLKPSAFDPDSLPALPVGAERMERAGLILGGDAGTVRYARRDWDRLFEFLHQSHERHGTRWVISNSPRTPNHVSQRISNIMSGDGTPVVDWFIDVREPDAEPLAALFETVGCVVCTADSSSMLSECVWARKVVVAVAPQDFTLPDNETLYRAWLEENGWCRALPIAGLIPESFKDACATVSPLTANPLERLADEISQRLPALFS